MSMMNVKETLKRLHKRLPTLSLDELFELLDCYVEQSTLSTFPNWEPNKVWYSTDKTTSVSETPKISCITNNTDPGIYTVNTNLPHGKLKYYDGGGSTQLVAEH
jgi:hypothetical protein